MYFQGSIILGMGFTFDDANAAKGKATSLAEMQRLIDKDPRNAARIKPYLGGSEVNTDPQHKHHRYVIDFEDYPLKRDPSLAPWANAAPQKRTEMLRKGIVPADYERPVAADWPDLLEIVERMVKPERDKQKRESNRDRWWIYGENRPGLMSALTGLEDVLVLSRVSPNLAIAQVPADTVFADSCVIFTKPEMISILSSVHEIWARLLSSSMKDDLRYSPTDCLQNFATPEHTAQNNHLISVVADYLDCRAAIMTTTNLGMTATYNRFHNPTDRKDDITELRRLHAAMDYAVLRAYGWDDLADMAADTSEGGAAPRFLHRTDEPEFAYQNAITGPHGFATRCWRGCWR